MEEEGAEIGFNIQNSDNNNDIIEQTSQVNITTNDGEYFINTIEITEDELNEHEQILHRGNQDYQIQLIETDTDLSQYKIDSVVSINSNDNNISNNNTTTTTTTITTAATNADGTSDIQGYTSDGNYQEVIIINAEDLKIQSSTLGHSSLQDFIHANNDTSTTTNTTPLKRGSTFTNPNNSKSKFLLSDTNFSPFNTNQQQHSTNFILTTLEGKTFQISRSNELIQFPSTVSNDLFPITSSSNSVSNMTTGQQQYKIIVPTDLNHTQNLIPCTIKQHQSQRNKTNNNNNNNHYDHRGIFQEKVLNDEDLSIKIKPKSVVCYPGAKTNKLNKNKSNTGNKAKYQKSTLTATTNNNKTHATTSLTMASSNVSDKMLQDVNDNNKTSDLEIVEDKIDGEINYQMEEEVEAIVSQINQNTKNTENMVISTVDTSTLTTTTTTAVTTASSVSFVMGTQSSNSLTMTDNNNSANTVSVTIPGLPGVVCQLQRFMYTQGLCRVCLLEKKDVVSIFEDVNIKSNGQIENSRGPHASHRYNIIPAIKTLLDIEVKYGDGLPDQICSECIDNIMSFSVFRKKISIGHSQLNTILAQVKGTSTPTVIPELGERDMKKTDVYRHVDAIVKARELMNNSAYKHIVSRSISDRVLEKIFQALSGVVGFKSPKKLKDLENYVLNEPFVKSWFCYPCNLSIHGSKEAFAQHNVDAHHVKSKMDVLYPCDLCNQSFSLVDSTGQNYAEHWLQHLFFYECTECNKNMPSQKGLLAHKRTHSISNKIFQCDHTNCDKFFSKKAHLDAHLKTHLNPDRKRYLNWCKICGKGLTSSLLAHMSGVHSENRPYKCDICSKQFKRKEILVGHRENVHLNLKKFPCEGCEKRFHTTQSLKVHMRKHQETENFSCPICNKQIRLRSNYVKHLKIHQRCNAEGDMNKETDLIPIQVCIIQNSVD